MISVDEALAEILGHVQPLDSEEIPVLDALGRVLAQEATTLRGPDVGIGGEGIWSVQLSISVAQGTQAAVEAFSPGSSASAAVSIVFDNPNVPPPSSTVDYAPGECVIRGAPGAPPWYKR